MGSIFAARRQGTKVAATAAKAKMAATGRITVRSVVFGCLASLGIGRSLASLLYDTKPTDLTVILPVAAIFALAAVAATFVPCRRAAKIEPMQALRTE